MTSLTTAFFLPDARRHFFASKDDYLAFKAAWRAATASELKLPATFYAVHAVLTGRDLYRAFSPNRRRGESVPYGALVRALLAAMRIADSRFVVSRYWLAELNRVLAAEQAQTLMTALAQAAEALRTLELGKEEAAHTIGRGEGRFTVPAPAQLA